MDRSWSGLERPAAWRMDTRLLCWDTFKDGFGVFRFLQPVTIRELRIVPRGRQIFAPADQLLSSTSPVAFDLDVYVHVPPATDATVPKAASFRPYRLTFDGSQGETVSFSFDTLPTNAKSRLFVVQGAFEEVTVALYGAAASKPLPPAPVAPPPPVVVDGVDAAPEDGPLIERYPTPQPTVPPPALEDIQRLIRQRPPMRDVESHPLRDHDLRLALSVFDGDRAALAGAIDRYFANHQVNGDMMAADVAQIAWRDACDWSHVRLGKMTPRESHEIVMSMHAQDLMLDDDHPNWVVLRRMMSLALRLASMSDKLADSILTPTFLEKTMILACEASATARRREDLAKILVIAAQHPVIFLSLVTLPSYPAFTALQTSASEPLFRRQQLVNLLSSELADDDDVYTLADIAVASDTFPAHAVSRFLQHFGFLGQLERVLMSGTDIAEPAAMLLALTGSTAEGRMYLLQNFERSSALAGWISTISASRSHDGALLALRQMQNGELVFDYRDACLVIVGLVSITGVAAALQSSHALAACACLRFLCLDGPFAPFVVHIFKDDVLLGHLIACAIEESAPSAWHLLALILRDPLLYLSPRFPHDKLDLLAIEDVPISIRALVDSAHRFYRLSDNGSYPEAAFAYALAARSTHDFATHTDAIHEMTSYAHAVLSITSVESFAMRWAKVSSLMLAHEIVCLIKSALDAADRLQSPLCIGEDKETLQLYQNPRRWQQTLLALLDLADVVFRILVYTRRSSDDTRPFCKLSVRSALFCESPLFATSSPHALTAHRLRRDALTSLSSESPTDVVMAIAETCEDQPHRTSEARRLLSDVLPSTASITWAKALMGAADAPFLLGNTALSGQLEVIDVGPKQIGLAAVFRDIEMEAKSQPELSVDDLLSLANLVGTGQTATDTIAGFSVKNYRGDAFRVQASEKIHLTRPPSMHVDYYEHGGAATQVVPSFH